jgi:NCAIR mutase (PurE)-related protein
MNPGDLKSLLEDVSNGRLRPDDAIERLRRLPYADLGFAKVDLHRHVRHGHPEVIFCAGKTPAQVLKIV